MNILENHILCRTWFFCATSTGAHKLDNHSFHWFYFFSVTSYLSTSSFLLYTTDTNILYFSSKSCLIQVKIIQNNIVVILFLFLVTTTSVHETFAQYYYDEINHRLTQNPVISCPGNCSYFWTRGIFSDETAYTEPVCIIIIIPVMTDTAAKIIIGLESNTISIHKLLLNQCV